MRGNDLYKKASSPVKESAIYNIELIKKVTYPLSLFFQSDSEI